MPPRQVNKNKGEDQQAEQEPDQSTQIKNLGSEITNLYNLLSEMKTTIDVTSKQLSWEKTENARLKKSLLQQKVIVFNFPKVKDASMLKFWSMISQVKCRSMGTIDYFSLERIYIVCWNSER